MGVCGERLDYAIGAASFHKQQEIAHWLNENQRGQPSGNALNCAAISGDLWIVWWLHSSGVRRCCSDTMDLAARHDHLNVVKWFYANRRSDAPLKPYNPAGWLHLHYAMHVHTYLEGVRRDQKGT